jgi:hypothetical protein
MTCPKPLAVFENVAAVNEEVMKRKPFGFRSYPRLVSWSVNAPVIRILISTLSRSVQGVLTFLVTLPPWQAIQRQGFCDSHSFFELDTCEPIRGGAQSVSPA